MENKLKALKVVDLKSILTKAKASAPAKATKVDLIARILANKDALVAYNSLYPSDDLLAPPEEIDWSATQELTTKPAPNVSISEPAPQPPVPQPTKPPITIANSVGISADSELERRKQRAARFGIPFVEPSKDIKPSRKAISEITPAVVKTQDNGPEKIKARAARFGLDAPSTTVQGSKGQKRAAPAEQFDLEEQERRRKRAERFGLGKRTTI